MAASSGALNAAMGRRPKMLLHEWCMCTDLYFGKTLLIGLDIAVQKRGYDKRSVRKLGRAEVRLELVAVEFKGWTYHLFEEQRHQSLVVS